jgi:hypothetical protein
MVRGIKEMNADNLTGTDDSDEVFVRTACEAIEIAEGHLNFATVESLLTDQRELAVLHHFAGDASVLIPGFLTRLKIGIFCRSPPLCRVDFEPDCPDLPFCRSLFFEVFVARLDMSSALRDPAS